MPIINPSLRYEYTGRRRSTKATKAKAKSNIKHVTLSHERVKPFRRSSHDEIPSGNYVGNATTPDNSYKVKISSQYTIAPAYNKGAYQVINRSVVKDIGR